MTLTEALARLERLYERRIARADGYHVAADAYADRLQNDVLHWSQSEMLNDMMNAALRSEQAMLEDAAALKCVLDAVKVSA
jgi:hypothetical protein